MYKKNLLIFFLLLSLTGWSQKAKHAKNGVYMELGGTGLFYSINYERLLVEDSRLNLTSNIGVTYIPHFFPNSDFKYVLGNSIGISTLIGSKKHFADVGFNLSYWYMNDIENNKYLTTFLPLRLGYKYQKHSTGIFYKLAFMPIIPIYQDADVNFLYPFTPHFAIGIGWGF